MSPYRDNREALRVRAGELDRLLVEKRSELARLRSARSGADRGWYWAAALLFVMALFICGRAAYHREEPPTGLLPLRWQAQVVAASREGLPVGVSCSVEISEPCRATVQCGNFAYRGVGRCEDCRYVDGVSTQVDGTPECEIDARLGRVFLREVASGRERLLQERWSSELVRQ